MKIVIACDSFKESLSAKQACNTIATGISVVDEKIECVCVPMADGGEGTTEVIMEALQAIKIKVNIHNPMQSLITAWYGFNDEKTAIIEVAQPCGIHLIAPLKRNPCIALSNGLGEMILDALHKGAKKIIIALGGSVTNDGGFGMLYALGAKFYDKDNALLPLQFDSILKINDIDLSEVIQKIENCEMIVASDVKNVFIGNQGATYVFGKQKGASQEQLVYLENCMIHLNTIFMKATGIDLSTTVMSGSAGGIGGALYLLNATMESGIDLVIAITQLEKQVESADYVISGEGSIDSQTRYGKTIAGIAKVTKKYGKPFIIFGGSVSEDAQNLYELGVTAMFSVLHEVKSLPEVLKEAERSLYLTTINVIKLIMKKV